MGWELYELRLGHTCSCLTQVYRNKVAMHMHITCMSRMELGKRRVVYFNAYSIIMCMTMYFPWAKANFVCTVWHMHLHVHFKDYILFCLPTKKREKSSIFSSLVQMWVHIIIKKAELQKCERSYTLCNVYDL